MRSTSGARGLTAGGDQLYWTVSYGVSERMGMSCRECRGAIHKGQRYVARDGRKIRLCYHLDCFSGEADPRTQSQSSYTTGSHGNIISNAAPECKGSGKWSVSHYGLS